MDYPQYDDRSSGNAKDGAVGAVEEMAVERCELFVFGDQRTVFGELLKCSSLLLQPRDECSGLLVAVGSDVGPDLLNIPFCGRCDLDAMSCGHS
jgi:hypothetical protein